MSEDQVLKQKEKIEIKIEKEKNKNDKNDKLTEIPENQEEYKNIKKKKQELPIINIRKISNLSDSVINYFVISVNLFMYAAYNLEWFHLNQDSGEGEKFLMIYYLFGGISLYIIGILNWYEGKELLFLFDFIFSFLFMTLFTQGKITSRLLGESNDKLQGIFYILLFCLLLILGISSKEKGLIYIINYAILFVGFVFLFAFSFFGNKWIKYIYSYAFIVGAALLWIIGILKLINNSLIDKSLKILDPTD